MTLSYYEVADSIHHFIRMLLLILSVIRASSRAISAISDWLFLPLLYIPIPLSAWDQN